MGIPFLFHNIVKNAPMVVRNSLVNKPSRLFLDYNSIIHMCSAAVVSQGHEDWQKIFQKVIEHTMNNVVNAHPPSKLLYIAIDGVAPLAKIQQQRKRRYMSAYRNNLINEFKRKHNIPISNWDSNIITPGTEFMKELDMFLKTYFHKNKYDFDVYVSGSDEPGEGEHKMIRYIKECDDKTEIDVIYGLDADLIMLCLTCDKPNIFLMRESSTFEDIVDNTASFAYLEIDRLKEVVERQVGNVRDYVALSYFLGNDFLPHLPFLRIRSGGMDILKHSYKRVKAEENLVLFDGEKYYINEEFLTKLLEDLSSIEDTEMQRIHNEWVEYSPRREHVHNLDHSLERYPHLHKANIIKKLNMKSPKWRDYYRHEMFGDSKKSTANEYIRGVYWITNYYMNNKTTNDWSYEYGYAPAAMDLYLVRFASLTRTEIPPPTITAATQLAIVLPPSSLTSIMPSFPYKHASVSYMYPKSFEIDIYLKNYLWECVPRLPSINVDKISKMVKSIEKN